MNSSAALSRQERLPGRAAQLDHRAPCGPGRCPRRESGGGVRPRVPAHQGLAVLL